jgi:hypothetical protein
LTNLQLKFDPNQDYQPEAVRSIAGLLDGLLPQIHRRRARPVHLQQDLNRGVVVDHTLIYVRFIVSRVRV